VTSNDQYVLELLLEQGVVDPHQADHASKQVGGQSGASAVDWLVREGVLEENDVLGVLAEQLGLNTISLKDFKIEPELRDSIPVEIARRYKVVPVIRNEDSLTVAVSDPLDFDTVDALRHLLKCHVECVIAPRDEIKVALDTYYASEASMEDMLEEVDDRDIDVAMSGAESLLQEDSNDTDGTIIKLVTMIILQAYRHHASDIHLEPLETRFRIRYRIDGVLHEVDSPPKRLQAAIISRLKIMANMKISEKRIPQDGRIQVNFQGRELDLRVSTVPSSRGESVVMRILDKQSLALGLPALGFFADDQQTFERLIGSSDKILLVTGPTGSGKTTTLYACLQQINRPDVKIITVENPVEYQLSGVNQVQVREDIGLTFGAALRAILRQAPNVVMIGEIRDLETAQIAIETALTGHLVFSTLHTNDAPSAVTRLLDIGVKPFLVSSSLRASMSQRLVRCICESCKEPREPTETELTLLGSMAGQFAGTQLFSGRGCTQCSLTGYSKRKGIFEIFQVTDEIQKMIFDKVPTSVLRERAREMGMRTLREDGLRKVMAGITTVEEVLRVTMGDQN
jgi:type IV pilus assembly protein PilB